MKADSACNQCQSWLWVVFGLGIVWIVFVLIKGYPDDTATERFQSQTHTSIPWILNTMDRHARTTHSCPVHERFPDSEIPNTWIEIVGNSCEDGLPHTSDSNTIRIPLSVWNTSHTRRDSVLRHERVHIHQRRAPDVWKRFYSTVWNYTLHTSPPSNLPESIRRTVRGNPDTWPEPWACWGNRYWFLPTYTDTESPRLRNTDVRVWDAETGRWCPPPLGWRNKFCRKEGDVCPHQWEHPHEMSAEMWTDMSDWVETLAGKQIKQFMISKGYR